jgi:hypothetical protein
MVGMTNSDVPRLPGLSARDTHWLGKEACRVLAELGRTAEVIDGVALRLVDDNVLGLDNLARTVSRLPRRKWRGAVRDQLVALLSLDPTSAPDPSALRTKLWPRERADDFLKYEPLEPLPGVVAILAAQGQGATLEFGELDLIGDREDAYATALDNMSKLPLPRWSRRRIEPQEPSSWVEFLHAEDALSAARVVILPDLVRRVFRTSFPATGVIIAVPTKHDLWVHFPVDEGVLQTAFAMAYDAYMRWAQAPYPITPDVFVVSPDMQAERLLVPDRQGVDVNEAAMARILDAVSEPPHRRAS